MFKVLRNGLPRYILYTCPNLNVTRVQSATHWTASVHTLHMPKPNVTRVQSATQWTALVYTLHMPQKKEKVNCWQCGEILSRASSSSSGHGQTSADVLQCSNCRMPGRHPLQLSHASLSWTPFWSSMRRGFVPQFKIFLRLLFLIGVTRKFFFCRSFTPKVR